MEAGSTLATTESSDVRYFEASEPTSIQANPSSARWLAADLVALSMAINGLREQRVRLVGLLEPSSLPSPPKAAALAPQASSGTIGTDRASVSTSTDPMTSSAAILDDAIRGRSSIPGFQLPMSVANSLVAIGVLLIVAALIAAGTM
jgi:hypothetical protein